MRLKIFQAVYEQVFSFFQSIIHIWLSGDQSTNINCVITQKTLSPFTAIPIRTMCPSFPLTLKKQSLSSNDAALLEKYIKLNLLS